MPFLLSLALRLGVPARFAKFAVFAALAVALLAVLGTAKCVYDRSIIRKHDTAQQLKIERDKLAQAAREREATTALVDRQRADEAAATNRQREIDNATRNIPDQAPSARQRSRVCIELRREAKTHGRNQPACQPASAP